MKWIKKVFSKINEEPEKTGIELPSLNWFIHTLINNVGFFKWVKKSREEQIEYDKEHPYDAGYPYKAVKYPIPHGKNIILKDDKTFIIKCDSEYTRNLIIEMARSYDELEKKYNFHLGEKASETWHKIEELPPHSLASSFRERGKMFLVSSPVLCYVTGGIALGFRDGKKWYIIHKGKEIECPITHFRYLPPRPLFEVPKYDEVKEQVKEILK